MMQRAQPWLGTLVELKIADPLPQERLNLLFQQAFELIATVHRLMSFHQSDSDISRYNRAPPGSILQLDPHTCSVLKAASHWQQASAGLFNIGIGRQLVRWDYLPAPASATPDAISSAAEPLQSPGWQWQSADQLLKLSPDWIDVGGIAKGYAVDLVCQLWQAAGLRSALVNAGGDMRAIGSHTVWLRSPQQPALKAWRLELQDQAIATSASYFSRRSTAKEQRCAMIDPRSGRAVDDCYSYSVLASDCMTADALTKILAISRDADHPAIRAASAEACILK